MKRSLKKIFTQIIIEIVAIFLAITIAFYVDDLKEKGARNEELKTYYTLMKNELSKDTLLLQETVNDYQFQIIQLERVIASTHLPDTLVNSLKSITMLPDRLQFLVGLETSGSLVSIYDSEVLSLVNDIATESEMYDRLCQIADKKQLQLIEKNFASTSFSKGKTNRNNVLICEQLSRELGFYLELLKSKYLLVSSISQDYAKLIRLLDRKMEQ